MKSPVNECKKRSTRSYYKVSIRQKWGPLKKWVRNAVPGRCISRGAVEFTGHEADPSTQPYKLSGLEELKQRPSGELPP